MIDILKDTEIIRKVGGKFKLSALIQKRLQEMMGGSRPLIADTEGLTQIEIVVREILEGKIAIEWNTAKAEAPAFKL